MAKTVKPLTPKGIESDIIERNKEIEDGKRKNKDYTLSDGNGLQLLVKTNGKKLWEFFYIRQSTQKRAKTSFGIYPKVSLKDARNKRAEYQKLINNGIDPIEYYSQQKQKAKELQEKQKHTIGRLTDAFFQRERETKGIDATHQLKEINRLNNHFISHLPKKEVTLVEDINFNVTIAILKKLETLDKIETLQRVRGLIVRLFKYLFSENIITSTDLFAKLEIYTFKKDTNSKENPTLTKKEDIAKLYNDILNYNKSIFVKYLLILTIHTAQRQGTLIKAKWSDIDLDAKLWTIPKEDMKMKNSHLVPLSDVMIDYLKELHRFSGNGVYLFPNSQTTHSRNKYPYISNNTANKALRIMGYPKEIQTAHGFRAMFKTVCKEHQETDNLKNEFVERILAHTVGGRVENIYNRADNIREMRIIIEWWSNFLEGLKDDVR